MSDFLDRIAKLPPERLALLAAELKERLDEAQRTAARNRTEESVAIIGFGCRFPGGGDGPEGYWAMLRDGVDAVREVPEERWDREALRDADPDAPGKMVTCRGGFLDGIDSFDARFFGIAPREAVSVDPQHRLLLEVTWEALEHAGIAGDRLASADGGVFVGLCGRDYFELMLEQPIESVDGYFAAGVAGSMAAGRIAYLLGLSGPALTVDTACSSSLVAVHLACESLRGDECRFAIAGGANLMLGIETMVALTKAQMLSPDGRCSTFDERANGIVRGEGCGVVVLKRLSDALADGDPVHAVIRSTAINQDGRSSGITAPNGSAQEALMRRALSRAGLAAQDIDYVEAHGTGTRLGDPIEVRALGAVYGDRDPARPLKIGSVKTNFGHLEAAAGIAGLLKVVLALRARQLPPHLHLERRNPLIEWDRWPLEIPTALTPWGAAADDAPRRAAVSSFGFSGTNAHVILEEAPAVEVRSAPDRQVQLLALSARTDSALRTLATRYADALGESTQDASVTDVCYTAALGRARFRHRLCVIASVREEAAASLRAYAAGKNAPGVASGSAAGTPDVVFLFTGQGSQHVNMGRELFDGDRAYRSAFEHCDRLLRPVLDVPLVDVVYPSTADERARADDLLARTEYAQPALLAVQYALVEVWRSWGIEPAAVAGHSIGEFAAAVVAGALELEDALGLVAARGRLMQGLAPGGGMAAVLCDAHTVQRELDDVPGVEIAAYNAPSSCVIAAGDATVLASSLDRLARRGIEAQRLAVSHAFHSASMDPILDALEDVAGRMRFSALEIPFVSTVTGSVVDATVLRAPAYWRDHARRPVRFSEALVSLQRAGYDTFLEVGPHAILSALGRLTLDDAVFAASLRRGERDRDEMLKGLAALHVQGVEPAWKAVLGVESAARAVLPTYPFERTRHWIGWTQRGRSGASGDAPADGATPGLLWKREWVRATCREAPAADLESVRAAVEPRAAALVTEHGGNVYSAFLPRLDALCAGYVVEAMRELGVRAGETVAEEDLCRRASIEPGHAALLHRMFEILAEDGFAAEERGGVWRLTTDLESRTPDPAVMLGALVAEFPSCRVETELTGRCGARLADVLRGRTNPLELLFPGGSLESTERLYAGTPSFRVFNTLTAETVAGIVRGTAGRRMRILEIGAGTGGTASRLLPLLQPFDVEYVFTDVSPVFLERARETFREYDFVDYRLLDISKSPISAGFTGFDVVVASNVLHATPDLAETLAHVREALVPGGALVMLEGLRPQRFGDLTVGMTEGWWCFTDTSLRPGYALMDRGRWIGLLERSGFEAAGIVPGAADGDGLLGQQGVLTARAPAPSAGRETAARRWLAIARAGGESGRLVEALRTAGLDVEAFDPGEDAGSATVYEAELAEHATRDVVHLLSLDESAADGDSGTAALERQQRSVGSALAVVQAAVRAGARMRLTFVTRAALAAGAEHATDPTGAPLWGFARTTAVEYPEIGGLRVDLPADWEAAVPMLAAQLGGAAGDDEIAIRESGLLAARVVAHEAGTDVSPLRFDASASYIVTGGLGGLGLRVAEWLAVRGAGHLVLCGRSAPTAQARRVIDGLEAAGVEVRVVNGDIADEDCIHALLEAAGETRLRGVFHSAGVTADATLLQQDWSRFERVMRAKVAGAWNLHRATAALALDHFVLFSTGAAFLGMSGQANHAAANAFLGALAEHRRARGLPALAIDWGAWTEIGAATRGDVLERARAVGLGAVDPETGLDLLERAMRGHEPQLAALAIDWPAFFERHPHLAGRPSFERVGGAAPGRRAADVAGAAETVRSEALAERVLAAPEGRRTSMLFDGLHAEAARALGLAADETIDARMPLTELGLDSLMAVELRNVLGTQLRLPLPATLLFTYPTLAELTEHIAGELGIAALEGGDGAVPDIDSMDEDALSELLERKLSAEARKP